MIFSLEALQAFHGDSLLLHAGTADEPLLVLIDGGPSNTWETSLQPRLEQLRAERTGDAALRIDLAMVSHIDDDHVHGMVDLAGELVSEQEDSQPLRYDVRTLWHNSFDDVLGDEADAVSTAAIQVLGQPIGDARADELRAAGLAVVASVGQGRELRDQAAKVGWGVNEPFDGPVVLPETGRRAITLGDMTLTVVCPHQAQLDKLQAAWDKWLRQHPKAIAGGSAQTAAYVDNSPYNLSSIVVLAECDGKRMLLTGDARGDHVLAGLDEAAIAKDGKTHVDILKLPHHGSIRNLAAEFFERVTADHYVISADGRDGNPETETLETIAAARAGDDDFEIHLTNRAGNGDLKERLDAFLAAKEASGRTYRVSFRDVDALSLRIDLLDQA
jgi:beta-lactamase superfamily II metal-dependent hydrolase